MFHASGNYFHSLRDCSHAHCIWLSLGVSLQVQESWGSDVMTWLKCNIRLGGGMRLRIGRLLSVLLVVNLDKKK